MSKANINMLDGPLVKPMIYFALPLIASGLLQQSFNSVDVAVAGRFAGKEALAAVGCNGPVLGTFVNLFLGLSVGANVVIANYIGQRNRRSIGAAVGGAYFLAIVCGIFLAVTSQFLARPILTVLDTPAEVLDAAIEYFRILGLGMPFLLIYNFGAAVCRSIGDTRTPFYSLVVSGLVNVGLNFAFVAGFNMGVAGLAWATAISTGVNAAIITIVLIREKGDIKLDIKNIRWQRTEIVKICRIGLPAGLQTTVFSISNVFIVGAINTFGADAAAGSAAAINFEFYCYFVMTAFAQTATAFISQNYGAGNLERCHRVFRLCLIMALVSSFVLNVVLTLLRRECLMVFTADPAVLVFGSERMVFVLLFQFIASYYEVAGSSMRGMGHSLTPALITIFGTCVLRLVWVGTLPAEASFGLLLSIYPITWSCTDILMWIAFRRIIRSQKKSRHQSMPA